MRADRLLSILLVLQTQGRATTRELAERVEVSARTIHRDMDALTAAGVPVYADRGVRGGWRLLGEYRTNLTGLTEMEAKALLFKQPDQLLGDLGLSKVSEGAFIKLTASLPNLFRREAAALRDRVFVEARGQVEAVPHLPMLLEAMWQNRKLRLMYERNDGETRARLAAPLGLVAKGSTWYLAAEVEGSTRTYRVSRIRQALLSHETFDMPRGFRLQDYWERSRAEFKAELPRYYLTARVQEAAFKRLGLVGRWASLEHSEPCSVGWLRARIRFEVEEDALAWALSMGTNIEVLEPLQLRKSLLDTVRQMNGLYSNS